MAAPTSSPGRRGGAELLVAYRESDKDFRVAQAFIGCILVLICMPGGLALDWFAYPQHVLQFFIFGRLLCDVLVLPLFLMLLRPVGRKYIDLIAIAWPILPAVAISWMIYASEGARSPYYAGLNLVLIVACQLMPYTFREALFVCITTLVTYLLACWANSHFTQQAVQASILFNNIYFIVITTVICLASCHSNTKRRMQEFGLRRELDQRNRELAEMDRLKSEFFANVSHELRTPLTLILSPVDRALNVQANLDPALRQLLDVVRHNGLRLLKLITDLLEIVRLDQKGTTLRQRPTDLLVFVKGLLDSMRHLAEQKNIRLECAMGERSPAEAIVVNIDHNRMEKVVLNIMTNAIKFTPAGGSIAILVSGDDGQAIVRISDTGIGIPAKDLPHIFERFRQADGSATRKYQGMGIGLSLARELVHEHGGTLSAESEEGEGTTLEIRLPLMHGSVCCDEIPSTALAESDPVAEIYRAADRFITAEHAHLDWNELAAESGEGEFKVMVIEDEPDLRKFIVSELSAVYRVRQAADGQRGLDSVRAWRPDLVLSDIMLPELDGLKMCRRIKEDATLKSTKVVLLTARTDEASKLTALSTGADDYLQKPFDTRELRGRIANLLATAKLESDLRHSNANLTDALHRLKATEVQLVQSEKMNAIGRLSAGILHEINNPLNAALMAVRVAQRRNTDAMVGECLTDIDQAMNRIKSITTDLRSFANPASEMHCESFALESVVNSALQLLSHELSHLKVDHSQINGQRICGNRNQIIHLLINLLQNAVYATRATANVREPSISIHAELENHRIRVAVRDNGEGIAPEHLAKVAEPFYTTREVGQGMGLGLSICHTIVKNHGGTLEVQSSLGHWTVVSFDLPLDEMEKSK